METQKWKWNCFRKPENCTKIKQETPWTWLDNRNIKNTNRRDLRNLIGAFIQLLPFFCQRIKRFRLQFSTASVIKLPHSPCKTLLQCDAWMNSQFHFPWELWRVKNGASFLLTGSDPLLLGMTMLMASLPFLPLVGPLLPPTITNHNHLINSASSQGFFVNNANGNVSHLYCTNPIFICMYLD